MNKVESKTGNGAFEVYLGDDGKVAVRIESGPLRTFDECQTAYESCVSGYADLQGTMRGYSYLNAAYALEDLISR